MKHRIILFGRIVGQIGEYKIRSVNGEAVRAGPDRDFTMGGNSAIYPNYVPRGEIWVDDRLSSQASACTILHELVEEKLMRRFKFNYDKSHDIANNVEMKLRQYLVKHGKPIDSVRTASTWYRRWLETL